MKDFTCGTEKKSFENSLRVTHLYYALFSDIEVANRHGHTCLMIACYKGHFDIAKYLIEITANVNRKSVKGNTALHDCAESGSLDIMKLLLDHNAKMDVDSYGESRLDKNCISKCDNKQVT